MVGSILYITSIIYYFFILSPRPDYQFGVMSLRQVE